MVRSRQPLPSEPLPESVPPIFVFDEDDDVRVFSSMQAAATDIEPCDVHAVVAVFDSAGQTFRMAEVGGERTRWTVTSGAISVTCTGCDTTAEELERRLRAALSRPSGRRSKTPAPDLTGCALPALIERAVTQRFTA